MIFEFMAAIRVKLHYEYLIGKPLLPTEHPITNIAWAPIDDTNLEYFLSELIRTNGAMTAYIFIKLFNKLQTDNVQMIIYSCDQGKWYWEELDRYLFANQIERFYLSTDFNILEHEKRFSK